VDGTFKLPNRPISPGGLFHLLPLTKSIKKQKQSNRNNTKKQLDHHPLSQTPTSPIPSHNTTTQHHNTTTPQHHNTPTHHVPNPHTPPLSLPPLLSAAPKELATLD
jgi:hypothetical protein